MADPAGPLGGPVARAVRALAASRLLPSRVRSRLYRATGLDVARSARIMPGVTFRPGRVRIGVGVFVNQDCLFDPGPASIVLEDGVALAPRVMLLAASHRLGSARRRAGAVAAASVVVGAGSWVGASAVVLGGVRIAPGCVIGAGAVVTRDTEPDGLYLGVPARRVRDLPAAGLPAAETDGDSGTLSGTRSRRPAGTGRPATPRC